ncbi:hypothetical protein [Streptomyces sp. bgisy034]|uniref:hypothetical protein n=1 Tax=Streptomyces sp. bgisy034 TaxID=3413774 RepID=UPI003EBE5BC5
MHRRGRIKLTAVSVLVVMALTGFSSGTSKGKKHRSGSGGRLQQLQSGPRPFVVDVGRRILQPAQ